MGVVVITTLLGLAVTAVALLRDEPVVPLGAQGLRPSWHSTPEPADLARITFPMSVRGYDPATVDVHMEAVLRAYEDLWMAAPEEVRERARLRAEARAGREAAQAAAAADGRDDEAVTVPEPPEAAESDTDALAAHAALAEVEARRRQADDAAG